MKRIFKTIVSLVLSVILIGTSMPTMAAKKVNNQKNDEKVTLIVRLKDGAVLEKDDIANGGKEYLKTKKGLKESRKILRTQSSVQSTIKNAINEDMKLKYSYTAVINGFAIEAKKSDIEKIKKLPKVASVSIAKKLKLYSENETGISNETSISDNCCEMLGIDDLKQEGYLGQGMTVAVIDNELDVNHQNFAEQPDSPKYSKEDVKSMLNDQNLNISAGINGVYRSAKIPFAYDYSTNSSDTYNDVDCHGTHVSGIVVGSGTTPDGKKTIGVAPQAQLFFFGISDMSNAAAIAAMDDVAKMGIDAVNCSWGIDYAAVDSELEDAIENLLNAGTYVAFAAGNSSRGVAGNTPDVKMIDYSTSGSPANSSKVTSVASADNISYWEFIGKMTVSGQSIKYLDCNPQMPFSKQFSDDKYRYVYCGYGTESELDKVNVKGKIALIKRGSSDGSTITFEEKAMNAVLAGATGVIFIITDEANSDSFFTVGGSFFVPVASVSENSGKILTDSQTKTIICGKTMESVKKEYSDGQTVSDFSSYGAGDDLTLKPDITATGGEIYSSVPDDKYEYYSGTSMASPHMAGAVLLFSQYLGNKFGDNAVEKNKIMENLLMSSANILYRNREEKIPYATRVQGAGLLNLKSATEISCYFIGDKEKSKLSLGDKLSDKLTLNFEIKNFSDHDVTYNQTDLKIVTDGYNEDDESGEKLVSDEVSLSIKESTLPDSITVKAGETKEVSVEVSLDKEWLQENNKIFVNGFYIDGFIELAGADDSSANISMPFMGFYGNWESEPIFDATYYSGNSKLEGTFLGTFEEMCMGGYDENGIFIDYCRMLGTNLYTEGSEYDKEEYVAISPNGDGNQDNLCVNITPLRNCKNVNFIIKNEKGDVIEPGGDYIEEFPEGSEEVNELLSKFGSGCRDYFCDYFNNCPDGKYYVEVSAKLDYFGATQTQSITLPFVIDRDTPKISDLKCSEEDGKKYLEMTFEDNNNLMGYDVYENSSSWDDADENGVSEVLDGTAKKSVKVDVTGMNRKHLEVTVSDYAGNQTTIKVENGWNEKTTPTPTTGKDGGVSETKTPETTVIHKEELTTTGQATLPTGTKITSVKGKKKSLLIKWKKQLKEVAGYEIQYSTSKKFAKKKTGKIIIKSSKKTSKIIKKLKRKKKYYVRIRTFKLVNGKRIYSKWSGKVSKRTK